MSVVSAKHDEVGVRTNNRMQLVKVARARSFPNLDLHASFQFHQGVVERVAFVIRRNAMVNVVNRLRSRDTRSVPVNCSIGINCGLKLGEDSAVITQHPGPIHHFT